MVAEGEPPDGPLVDGGAFDALAGEVLPDWLELDDVAGGAVVPVADEACWSCPPEAALDGGCAAAMPGNPPTISNSQARRRIVRPRSRHQSH
ncbi:hypothetical protein JQ604_16055 [Bradyrhizobium jicamae]|uniref:hypothetical protein n=1 Tax=Bradyrhizobium jicamae TaxID=280332 RepID=UPI001BA9D020|nr:hypothetical protein [Bradyrhizobium jicamae]MBR0753702.1 hypothetical protein [Bradyrhizobium jicamae]